MSFADQLTVTRAISVPIVVALFAIPFTGAFLLLGLLTLGVAVGIGVGDLLIFHNLDAGKLPDMRMIHAGLPITSGEKWLATRWIRGADYFPRGGSSSEPSP